MKFKVYDNKTGKEAGTYDIALHEEWARSLVYCDMEGFAITEDGDLVLMDECGNVVYCDADRFKVIFEGEAEKENGTMTNEDAIKNVNDVLLSLRARGAVNIVIPDLIEALQMAVNALADKNKLTCLECEGCGFCDTCDHKKDS